MGVFKGVLNTISLPVLELQGDERHDMCAARATKIACIAVAPAGNSFVAAAGAPGSGAGGYI